MKIEININGEVYFFDGFESALDWLQNASYAHDADLDNMTDK